MQIAKEAIDGTRIDEEDIEMRPDMISSSYTDENVCLDVCIGSIAHEKHGELSTVYVVSV